MPKKRIDITMEPALINLLKSISDQQKTSVSALIAHAVSQIYQDRFEIAKEKVQHHGEQLEIWKEELKRIKKKRGKTE